MMPDSQRDSLLQQENATLREVIKSLKMEVDQLKQHNAVLRLKVDAMARKLFGKSSEKLDPAQLQLVLDALKDAPTDEAKKSDASDSPAYTVPSKYKVLSGVKEQEAVLP